MSSEQAGKSCILEVLSVRFLWDFSVHSFLLPALVTVCVGDRGCLATSLDPPVGLDTLNAKELMSGAVTFVQMRQSQ